LNNVSTVKNQIRVRAANAEALIIGDALIDHQYWIHEMPKSGEDVAILSSASHSGGSAANTAIALQKQGVTCAFCGRLGNDKFGLDIIAQMKEIGIDISCIQYSGDTGYTLTIIDRHGERTMFSYRNAYAFRPAMTKELLHTIQKAKVLFLSGYMLIDKQQADFVIDAARYAKRKGCYVMLDASPVIGQADGDLVSAVLSLTDIILPNRLELEMLSNTTDLSVGLERLHHYVPCIALKLGGKGSRLSIMPGFSLPDGRILNDKEEYSAEVERVSVIDTTGAGDSFNAGFTASFLRCETPDKWIKAGNVLASQVVARKGGGF